MKRVLLLLLATTSTIAIAGTGYVLPAPDTCLPDTAAPSIRGRIKAVAKAGISVKPDDHLHPKPIFISIRRDTQLFTAFGGFVEPSELRAGQYVWVWYVTRDPRRAGSPPKAAVVMPFSMDPTDQPSTRTAPCEGEK